MAHTLQIQFEMAIVSLFEFRFDVAQPILLVPPHVISGSHLLTNKSSRAWYIKPGNILPVIKLAHWSVVVVQLLSSLIP